MKSFTSKNPSKTYQLLGTTFTAKQTTAKNRALQNNLYLEDTWKTSSKLWYRDVTWKWKAGEVVQLGAPWEYFCSGSFRFNFALAKLLWHSILYTKSVHLKCVKPCCTGVPPRNECFEGYKVKWLLRGPPFTKLNNQNHNFDFHQA